MNSLNRRKTVRLLDLRLLHDFREMLLNELVREVGLELRLQFFIGGEELSRTLGIKLHNVETVLRLDRAFGYGTFLQSGNNRTERRREGVGDDPTQLTALSTALLVFGEFLSKLREVVTLLETLDDVLGLIFRLDENVADLVFRVTVKALLSVVGILELSFGDWVLVSPVLEGSVNENLVVSALQKGLDFGLRFDASLLGFLKKHGVLNGNLLDHHFKLFTGRLTLGNGSVVNDFLLGHGDGFTVYLERLEFGVGSTGCHHGSDTENQKFLLHS